jgi:putative membrane protein
VSALLLVAWDLALDPAMSRLAPYWVWGAPGPYFGMPLLNLAGWYVTGAVLSGILVVAGAIRWVDDLPESAVTSVRWIYGANLAMPIGMTLAAGLAWAAAASLGVLGIVFGASLIRDVRIARIVRRRASRMEALR